MLIVSCYGVVSMGSVIVAAMESNGIYNSRVKSRPGERASHYILPHSKVSKIDQP